MSGIPPAEWLQAYWPWWRDPHRHGSRDAILRAIHRWRGTAHRVLLRNPYADIGLTCLDASRRLDRRADRP
jgi:hypothetical protein